LFDAGHVVGTGLEAVKWRHWARLPWRRCDRRCRWRREQLGRARRDEFCWPVPSLRPIWDQQQSASQHSPSNAPSCLSQAPEKQHR